MNLYRHAGALIAIAVLAALPGCKAKPDSKAQNDAPAQAGGRTAPGSLAREIVVDPARARTASAEIVAAPAPSDPCAIRYGAVWAARLMPEFPVYPGARIGEAAGSDAPGCRKRIVSFATAAPTATIVAYYDTRARKAGYSAEHLVQAENDVLGGTRGDAAYYITVTPAKGGSAVDLVTTPGG